MSRELCIGKASRGISDKIVSAAAGESRERDKPPDDGQKSSTAEETTSDEAEQKD